MSEVDTPGGPVNEQNISELAAIIEEAYSDDYGLPAPGTFEDCADAILAAGWRPPARVIRTPEELDALPEGSIIRATLHHNQNAGDVWEKYWRNEWLKLDPSDRDDGESTYDARIVFAHKYAEIVVVWESGDPR